MSNSRITPFVKRMRVNGGTIFSFSSAVEDIGLNINEKNNVVKISNYALLNIPSIDEPNDITQNYFNIRAINGAWEYEQDNASIKDGRILISESFENYALNLETWLLDQSNYNPTLLTTVSERVFWKWMKETGATRWIPDASSYWTEELDIDGSAGYNTVIKYVGQVSAGNVRQDTFGTYNETYLLVPTSHGETRAYFKQVEDENYYHNFNAGDGPEKILGRQDFLQPHPDGLSYNAYYDYVDSSTQTGAYTLQYDASTGSQANGWWWSAYNIDPGLSYGDNAYWVDPSSYIDTGIYHTDLYYTGGTNNFSFRRSNVDCMSLEFDLDKLKILYNDPTLTYDKMAIQYATNDTFDFNAVLIYYTVYNSTMDVKLATNLLGVMFLDAPEGNSANIGTNGILIPSLEKIMSTGTGFGTSYSLRLNIKTDNMIDDTGALVVDFATSDQLYGEDFSGIFYELGKAVNILTQNNATTNFISDQYITISSVQTQQENQIIALRNELNLLNRNIHGPENTVAMFSGPLADDPLIESSIYMQWGAVGIGETQPRWKLHVDGSAKVEDLVIENAIRDTSDNILLGYGSPLQLGASTNAREISLFTNSGLPAMSIDTSKNINIFGDVSIRESLYVKDAIFINGQPIQAGSGDGIWNQFGADIFYALGSVGIGTDLPVYDLDVSANIGIRLGGDTIIGGHTNIEGSTNINDSLFVSGQVGIGKIPGSYSMDTSGNINIDGSIFLFGVPFTGGGGGSLWSEQAPNIYFNTGNVGVGVNNPTSPLDVSGHITMRTSSGIKFNGAGDEFFINNDIGDFKISNLAEGFSPMVISAGDPGNVLFPNATVTAGRFISTIAIGTAPLTVTSTTLVPNLYAASASLVNMATSVDTNSPLLFKDDTTTGKKSIKFDSGIYADANANKCYAVDWVATSDERLKEDYVPYGNVLDKISLLKDNLINFKWKESGFKDTGYLAQDLEQFFPEFVETGNSERKLKSISYGKLSTVALKGIAELREEKDEEITSLKNKIADLTKLVQQLIDNK